MAYFLDTVIPDNAVFLFFSKAEQFGLFGTMTPVKGYVNKKTGKLVSSATTDLPAITKSWPFPKGARFLFYRAAS